MHFIKMRLPLIEESSCEGICIEVLPAASQLSDSLDGR